MCGSAIRFTGTGIPISHAKIDLSSELEIMRRLSSTKVIAGPRISMSILSGKNVSYC